MGKWFSRNRHRYPSNWVDISRAVRDAAGNKCEACDSPSVPKRILTVDHIDHDPKNNAVDNLAALCQRCHLRRQAMYPRPKTKAEAIRRLRERHETETSQGDLF